MASLSRRDRWITAFIALFLAPHLLAVWLGEEGWPWSAGAMFSQYLTPERDLYRFRFELVDATGRRSDLRPEHWDRPHHPALRQFFTHVYGSSDPASFQSPLRGDDLRAFSERMPRWCGAVLGEAQRLGTLPGLAPQRLDISVESWAGDGFVPASRIGSYDLQRHSYVHDPQTLR